MIMNKKIPFVWFTLLIFCCLDIYGQTPRETWFKDVYQGGITNDLRRALHQHNAGEEIKDYAKYKKVPIPSVLGVLKWFVKNERYQESFAISAIRDVGGEDSLPYLEELARQPNQNDIYTIFNSIARIGGSNAIEFARSVVAETNLFTKSNRDTLYDAFMHASVMRHLQENKRQMGLRFLVSDPNVDEKVRWVLFSDENMSKILPACGSNPEIVLPFRRCDQRIGMLSWFSTNAPARYREEFVARLKVLRQEREKEKTKELTASASTGSVNEVIAAESIKSNPAAPEIDLKSTFPAPEKITLQDSPNLGFVIIIGLLVVLSGGLMLVLKKRQ